MRIVHALLLSLALCVSTAANSKGSHGGSSYASSSYVTHSHSYSSVARDAHGRIKRDPAERAAFERHNPCPSTGRSSGACPGYVVDHVIPLKHGGADNPSNMQWQTKEAAKEKDRTE
jgi:hypothetical protein